MTDRRRDGIVALVWMALGVLILVLLAAGLLWNHSAIMLSRGTTDSWILSQAFKQLAEGALFWIVILTPLFLIVLIFECLGFVFCLRHWHNWWGPPPGHCPHCGYNLTGNESGVCPECSTPVPTQETTA